ncbi:hypothetical protein B0O80DRAFT_385945 [Mortierella sp. GBAus27b]|nr:hypothetical protein B0O80DRAFT_385945 [Mortierella sp. GBAus27b]
MLINIQPDFKLDLDSRVHTLKLLRGKSSSVKRIEYRNGYSLLSSSSNHCFPISIRWAILEEEWRYLGLRMSTGWVNYARHDPEPHVLMFRRTHDVANKARVAAAKRMEEEEGATSESAHKAVEEVEEEEEDGGEGVDDDQREADDGQP